MGIWVGESGLDAIHPNLDTRLMLGAMRLGIECSSDSAASLMTQDDE